MPDESPFLPLAAAPVATAGARTGSTSGAQAFVIPVLPGVPSQRLRVTLDRREYVLDVRWSMREAKWYLDIRDSNGAAIIMGIKIVTGGYSLLARYRSSALAPKLPAGDLMIDDGRANPTDPTLEELGASAQLTYSNAAMVAAIAADATVTGPGSPRPLMPRPMLGGRAEIVTSPPSRGVVTCSTGTWSGVAPMRFTYQWRRGASEITGATSNRYQVAAADAGAEITCRVTATNETGIGVADSDTTRVVVV